MKKTMNEVHMLITRFLDVITKKEKPLCKATNQKHYNEIISKTEDKSNG